MNNTDSDIGKIRDISYIRDTATIRHGSIDIKKLDVYFENGMSIKATLKDGTVIPVFVDKEDGLIIHQRPSFSVDKDISI